MCKQVVEKMEQFTMNLVAIKRDSDGDAYPGCFIDVPYRRQGREISIKSLSPVFKIFINDSHMKSSLLITVLLLYWMIMISCRQKHRLFQPVSSNHSGISFNNKIVESDSLNPIDVTNIYNGGGVGIGDFNNDGLQDVYLAGNMVPRGYI